MVPRKLTVMLLAGHLVHAFHAPQRSAWTTRAAPRASVRPANPARVAESRARISAVASAGDADATAPAAPAARGKSALVLGWFGASERELSLVERLYRRNGYEDVTVLPSLVSSLTKPSGWFETFRQHIALADGHPMGRHFDVVHAMSGGFLQLYLLRASRVHLSFDKLLLDSTPILPKPAAFANFQREFARDARGALAAPMKSLLLLPARLHAALVRAAWVVGAAKERARDKARRLVGRSRAPAGARRAELARKWVRLATGAALTNRFGRLVAHATKTALAPGAGAAREIIFLFNPNDPYISHGDLQATIAATKEACARVGCGVRSVLVDTKHVHTIVRQPRTIFAALDGA